MASLIRADWENADMRAFTEQQIRDYCACACDEGLPWALGAEVDAP